MLQRIKGYGAATRQQRRQFGVLGSRISGATTRIMPTIS